MNMKMNLKIFYHNNTLEEIEFNIKFNENDFKKFIKPLSIYNYTLKIIKFKNGDKSENNET